MKILIANDPHLNYQTPASRKDVYPQTIIDKIYALSVIAKDYGVSEVIFTGDIFHQRYQPLNYFMRCYQAFKSFSVPVYTIIGNHDVTYEREDTFEGSPLHLLVETGAIKLLSKNQLIHGDVRITGFDYFNKIVKVENKLMPMAEGYIGPVQNYYDVCVGHQYYNTPLFKEYVTPEETLLWGYDAYLFGHDHSVYEPVVNSAYKVIRDGSLSRGTAHMSNLFRKVYCTLFDTEDKTFTRLEVPAPEAVDVFKDIKYVEKSLEASVEDIVQKLDFEVGDSIYDLLDKSEARKDIIELIERYLVQNGIFRKAKEVVEPTGE